MLSSKWWKNKTSDIKLVYLHSAVYKIQFSLNSDKDNGYITWRQIYVFLSYLAQFFLECEILQTKAVEKNQNAHFEFNNCFSKIVPFMRQCGKILWSGEAHRSNMAHAHCMLDTYGYQYTHSACAIPIAFPTMQQWLHKRAPLLHHMYSAAH